MVNFREIADFESSFNTAFFRPFRQAKFAKLNVA